MTAPQLVWLDDAAQREPTDRWLRIAAELREQPGRWAQVRVAPSAGTAKSQAREIRNGDLRAFRPRGAYDGRSRDCRVEACFLRAP